VTLGHCIPCKLNLLVLYIIRIDVNFSDRRVTDTMQVKMYKTEGRKEGKKEEERNRMMERDETSGKKQLSISVFAP
jgi:hypothetical protein